MSIKEKDLQTLENLSDGDKLRVVTSEGNSRNVPANVVGGGGLCIETEFIDAGTYDKYYKSTEVTWEEAVNAIKNGVSVVIHVPTDTEYGYCYETWLRLYSFVPASPYGYDFDIFTYDSNAVSSFTGIRESDDHMVKLPIYID